MELKNFRSCHWSEPLILFFLGVILLSPGHSFCQNLIKNPSCEEYFSIPNNLAQYPLCKDWWKPNIWTTDYFSSLTNESNNNYIPQNSFGLQNNINGNFYLGIVTFDWFYALNNCFYCRSDYAGGQLIKKLEKGSIYEFEFWMSKADKGILKSNAIDLILTYDTIVDVNNYEPYGYKIWSEQDPMTDTINWVKISTCFKARGNEKAFVIGNFHELEEIVKIVAYDTTVTDGEIDYRYLDNFSLIECPTCCPELFSEEQQVYVTSNPSTSTNPAQITVWLYPNTEAILEVYDSAGRLVARHKYTELMNTFSFENFAEGMYHFTVQGNDGLKETGKVVVIDN
ncbi:MAG: T9SS type A sorting domain-containing protein [Bacteroidetes bacterium]|nr:MAG: T9SS type A sorting domain-containing protein [Bacteroidota bacterium]